MKFYFFSALRHTVPITATAAITIAKVFLLFIYITVLIYFLAMLLGKD